MKHPASPIVAPRKTAPRGGRAVAWIGFVFGSVISTAGNVLYTWIPPDHAPRDWAPSLTAQLFAAVWPLALLISVEVLSRVQWAPGWQWRVARYGGAGVVALGSAVISYGHLHGVLDAWHYGTLGSAVGPLVLDGLMAVCGFALLSPAASPAVSGQDAAQDAAPAAQDGVQDACQDAAQAAMTVTPAPVLDRHAMPSYVSSTAALSRPVGPSDAGQGQDGGQDVPQDVEENTETDPVRWAAVELSAGRPGGYVVLRRQFPDLSERDAKKVARKAREEQDAGLHVVKTG